MRWMEIPAVVADYTIGTFIVIAVLATAERRLD